MNEIIKLAKAGRGKFNAYSREKSRLQIQIACLAAEARLPSFERARIAFRWVEPNRRRDPDNVSCGKKFILDALVFAGVLYGDTQAHIVGMSDDVVVGDPCGIYVTLESA
jgi:hypothetical protein